MDLANYSKSLSHMINHEVFRDCNLLCLNEQTGGVPSRDCIANCAARHSQYLSTYDRVLKSELPKLQEVSRIRWINNQQQAAELSGERNLTI